MPVSAKLYQISMGFDPSEYSLIEIRDAIMGCGDEKVIPLETGEDLILERNFSDIRLQEDGLLWGIYQIDVPINTKERNGTVRIIPNLEEFNFIIKPNGKILFFGNKNKGGYFCSDISKCLRSRVPSDHVFYGHRDDICEEHIIGKEIMQCCVNSLLNQEISGAGFMGDIDPFITKKNIGGISLQNSLEFAGLIGRSDVNLYRLIFKLLVGTNIITLQITGGGLILGYFTQDRFPLSIMNDILNFLEQCGL